MTLRERFGLGGLLLAAGLAAATTFVMKPFVPAVFAADSDSDGLTDAFENTYGTNPNDATTDADGWNDWDEIFVHGTSPVDEDTDGDGTNDDLDSAPLDDATLGGGSADGRTTPTGTWSQNLTAPHFNGTSAVDGKGVYPHSGEFVHTETFLSIDAGYGPDIVISGTYRSGISYDGIYGKNWVFSFGERVVEQGDGDIEYYPAPDNNRGRKKAPPGMWILTDPGGSTPVTYINPAEAVGLTLVKTVDDTFTLTDHHGNETAFRTDGKIASRKDRFGNTTTYAYNGSNQLTTITDATGHSVSITYYSTTGRVKDVTDGNSRKVEFTYNYWGQLAKWRTPTSTEYPAGRIHEYRYSSGSSTGTLNDNMIRAIDPKGQVWLRNEFDASDRITKQYLGNDFSTFAYATGPTLTTVYDREGNQREWAITGTLPTSLKEYSNRDVRASDPASWQTSFGHTAAGLRNKTVYPRGNRVDMDYNADGQVTEIRRKTSDTDTDNNTNDIYETFAYDADYGLMTSHTDERGNTTTFALEDTGALADKVVETITHPTVTYLDPDQAATETLTWNSQGQLLTRTDGEGKETTLEYFGGATVKKGYLKKVIVDSTALDLTTEYDTTDWGTRKSVKNPRLKTTTYTVNPYDWITKIETDSPQGYESLFTFDANGNVTQKDVENVDKTNTRDTGNPWWTTTYAYDILDNLIEQEEEVASSTTRSWTCDYTKNERLKTLTKPEGNQVRRVYDERDLVFQTTRGFGTADASTEDRSYDGNRNLTSLVNGRDKEWAYTYDLFDRRTKETNPLTHYTEWIYDKSSNVTEKKRWEEAGATDVLMEHTKWSYDERSRQFKTEAGLKGVSSWSFLVTTTEFDKRGLPTKVVDPRSKNTLFTFDGAGRRTVTEDHLGNEIRHFYDANGNVTKIDAICASGCSTMRSGVTEFEYDECDRMSDRHEVNESDAEDKHSWAFKYDSLDVKVEETDAEGNVTTWAHDGLARVVEESIDLGSSVLKKRFWGYDGNDRLVSHEDDALNETTFAYNARDLCTSETYADLGVKTLGYDLADNLTDWEDPNGTVVEVTYDDNNRKTAVDVTPAAGVIGSTAEDWAYDALDRVTEAKDNDVTVQFTWDSLGRKKTEVSGPNPLASSEKTTSYAYDDAGNCTRIDYPDGTFYVTRTYDDVNRLTKLEDASSNDIVTIDFDDMTQRLEKFTFQNGTTSNFLYDGFGRVTDLDHKTSTPTTFAGYDMFYDDVGNMLYEEWSHDSGKGHNYAYDKADRLKKTLQNCNDPSAELALPGSQGYGTKIEYNLTDDSDRSSVVTTPFGQGAQTANYTSNEVHEYTVVGGVNRAYDANGNLTDDGTHEYAYDYRNQLVEVTRKSDSEVIGLYEHDPLGRRTKKTLEDDSVVRYFHDGHHEVEEFDGSGSLLRKYVYRDDIDSIAMMEAPDQADVDDDDNTSELVRLFYHCDGRTNVARLTAAAQTVVESYESDPYGNVTIKNQGGSSVSTSPVGNPVVFQRRRHDAETGLMYFRARHYDPQRGHWMQRDPLVLDDGPNAHESMGSNPVTHSDPTGTTVSRGRWWDIGNGVAGDGGVGPDGPSPGVAVEPRLGAVGVGPSLLPAPLLAREDIQNDQNKWVGRGGYFGSTGSAFWDCFLDCIIDDCGLGVAGALYDLAVDAAEDAALKEKAKKGDKEAAKQAHRKATQRGLKKAAEGGTSKFFKLLKGIRAGPAALLTTAALCYWKCD